MIKIRKNIGHQYIYVLPKLAESNLEFIFLKMNIFYKWSMCIILIFFCNFCVSYKPVFIIHGILAENSTMINFAQKIKEYHPGTKIYILSEYCGWNSLLPMMHQTKEIGFTLLQISALHPEGFHLIGYSQGGLLARAVLELFPEHRVHNFVSLSSPQAGQYGTNMLRIFFPHLIKEEAYKIFYSSIGQHLSVANYWNDPLHQSLFYKYSKFLPVINNDILPQNNSNFSYKSGIIKLHKLILIGGPDDGIIEPWESSQFGYYNENEEIVPMQNRKDYQKDLFGLKTLNKRGDLHIFTISGVRHHFWYRNITVIKQYILPWLN